MDWSFIVTWIKKAWQKFIDSFQAPTDGRVRCPQGRIVALEYCEKSCADNFKCEDWKKGTEVKPTPPVVVVDPPVDTGELVVWDGDLIPGMMQAQGWTGNGSQVYYALFSSYGSHEWGYKGDENELPTARELYAQRDKIKKWFTDHVTEIGRVLQANPSLTALLIKNDANDLGACFTHGVIRNQLEVMGISRTRLITGDVFLP